MLGIGRYANPRGFADAPPAVVGATLAGVAAAVLVGSATRSAPRARWS